jgi:hypothetical protein
MSISGVVFDLRTHGGQPQACILVVYNGARAHEHDSASSPYTGFTPRLGGANSFRFEAATAVPRARLPYADLN